ncbi:unnamed protein product [Ceutorhynchus assimilis]|uniref:Uncharacterized protein n=1 Tax=Ceutorhynchus assimilis TaxID=467358 RepID=A0A9N9MQK8_9CUCU|nr:unnamed protein product [Ceutorhynchus assimilis]
MPEKYGIRNSFRQLPLFRFCQNCSMVEAYQKEDSSYDKVKTITRKKNLSKFRVKSDIRRPYGHKNIDCRFRDNQNRDQNRENTKTPPAAVDKYFLCCLQKAKRPAELIHSDEFGLMNPACFDRKSSDQQMQDQYQDRASLGLGLGLAYAVLVLQSDKWSWSWSWSCRVQSWSWSWSCSKTLASLTFIF